MVSKRFLSLSYGPNIGFRILPRICSSGSSSLAGVFVFRVVKIHKKRERKVSSKVFYIRKLSAKKENPSKSFFVTDKKLFFFPFSRLIHLRKELAEEEFVCFTLFGYDLSRRNCFRLVFLLLPFPFDPL